MAIACGGAAYVEKTPLSRLNAHFDLAFTHPFVSLKVQRGNRPLLIHSAIHTYKLAVIGIAALRTEAVRFSVIPVLHSPAALRHKLIVGKSCLFQKQGIHSRFIYGTEICLDSRQIPARYMCLFLLLRSRSPDPGTSIKHLVEIDLFGIFPL